MRRRAFRPEVTGCLEDRSLMSGVGGLSADPVVLPRLRYIKVGEHIESSFLLFARDRHLFHLREQLRDVAVIIPFGRTDGLGASINRILSRMQDDLAARVPHAVRLASDDALAVTRDMVNARVQAGDVIVR